MLDIILFAAFAAFIAFRLYKTLGMKDFNESPMKDEGKVVPFPNKKDEKVIDGSFEEVKDDSDELIDKYGILIATKIKDIRKYDATFSDTSFLDGARKAFDIILKAFSKGDTNTLKPLLSKDLFKGFENEILKRKTSGTFEETTLLSIAEAKIKDITLYNKLAKISVEIESEQINLIKDQNGKILEGSPSQVDKVTEIWSFARNLSSNNPNWELVETVSAG